MQDCVGTLKDQSGNVDIYLFDDELDVMDTKEKLIKQYQAKRKVDGTVSFKVDKGWAFIDRIKGLSV